MVFKLAPKWCWKILLLHKQIRNFSTVTWASLCRLISAFFEHKFQGHPMKFLQFLKWSMLLDNETFQKLWTWFGDKAKWDLNQGVMSWGVWRFEIGGFLWALKIQFRFLKMSLLFVQNHNNGKLLIEICCFCFVWSFLSFRFFESVRKLLWEKKWNALGLGPEAVPHLVSKSMALSDKGVRVGIHTCQITPRYD